MKLLLLATLSLAICAAAETGIPFATVEGVELKLDLHRPQDVERPLVAIYVHGGAWRAGSREDVPVAALLRHGIAIASVDYQLSIQARFPAQVHDIKAAIRFLRAKADTLRIDTERIAIIGSSAGGHLAALTGLTNDHTELEGSVGDHLDQSSRIAAIVSFYGAGNLQSILGQSTELGLTVRVPALKLLLGNLPDQASALAALASPVQHLDRKDPPLLLIHGDADPQMPYQQSLELEQACKAKGAACQLISLSGGKHGGDVFYSEQQMIRVAEFLKAALKPHASSARGDP
jgi:acetyl esterase/lipase